ncbi:hypothetical protein WMY93_031219 [Mugilogobius chulae]|uniref:ZP domain-containing protein n=1 Tax=Mugilogobius chulae TaxID=88201 RepID=A0AAW0MDY8_9GOBI
MPFRSTIPFLCSFLLLLPLSISLGRCSDISFSLCWFNTDSSLESHNFNITLNGTSLSYIRKPGKLTSVTVYPGVENKLTVKYERSYFAWIFTLNQNTKFTKVRGSVRPTVQPTSATQSFLQMLSPSEVFACENTTLFFRQEKDFFLAIGHTSRLPLRLESRSSSTLLLSWGHALTSSAHAEAHSVGLYSSELASFSLQRLETTTEPHYRLTALDSCSVYVACVEISGTLSLTCLSTITDPDLPRDLEMTSLNSSSLSVSWECPLNGRYSTFLLTVYHHHLSPNPSPSSLTPLEEERVWVQDPPQWTLSDLPPCARLSFGVQTVCVSGAETRYSPEISHKGNSDQSNILNLAQSSSGPDWYSVNWDVGSFSSVSRFRLFHDGEEQGSTLNTSFTVSGLQPCRKFWVTVEALCGEETVMDAQTVQVHTDPQGISDLRFVPENSTVVWTAGSASSGVFFMFELSRADGGEILWSGSVRFVSLSVWEQCESLASSHRSVLEFKSESPSLQPRGRAAAPNVHKAQEPNNVIGLIVPWTLPEEVQNGTSDSWVQMTQILQNRMDELLRSMVTEVKVKLLKVEPAQNPEHTEFLFLTLNKSKGLQEPLWIQDYLPDLLLLKSNNVSIENGVIHWTGPDLCLSSPCPKNSVCLNSLGSFSCLCREGHYDVRAFVRTSGSALPVCNDKGMFSRCLDKHLKGGISKQYLSSRLKGALKTSLNHGQCEVNETQDFFYFKTPREPNPCGTRRRVNESHIELQNFLTVTVAGEKGPRVDQGRSLRVLWKCVYPRHYLRTALVGVDLEWLSSFSVVAFNTSLQLALNMSLFGDSSYSSSFSDAVMLNPDDTLFFQVSLQTSNSFIHDVRLQVESCWATESSDPQDQVQGMFLQDGCPVDDTFSWLSQNGASQMSRFSIQMFHLPQSLPLYFHCRASVCGTEENCTQNCSSDQRMKRSVSDSETLDSRAAVVSVGPLVVTKRRSSLDKTSYWANTQP